MDRDWARAMSSVDAVGVGRHVDVDVVDAPSSLLVSSADADAAKAITGMLASRRDDMVEDRCWRII